MKITITDIAKYAGVSRTTVSRVLNDSHDVAETTRQKVLEVIKEYDYSPNIYAKNLSNKESNTIGVMVPDITNPFFGAIIKGISQIIDKHDLNMILSNTDEDIIKERKYLADLKNQQLKALIMTPTSDANIEYYQKYLTDTDFPIVLIDRDIEGLNLSGVFIDNYTGAYDATKTLVENGHKKIALIAGPEDSKPGRERTKGYLKAMEDAKLKVDPSWVLAGDFKLASGYDCAKKIMAMENQPTAIFSANNLMTLGAIKALNEAKVKIPRDISLIGFDEIDLFNIFDLNVSTVNRPSREMGTFAMELLIKQFQESELKKAEKIILKTKMNLKGSEIKNKK